MKTGTALDMDMTQLGRSLGELYRWWTDELSSMIPARLRSQRVQRIAGLCAIADSNGGFSVDGETITADPAKAKPATILLPSGRVLLNNVPLPPLRRVDLRKLVALDLDRLMPFPPGTACADVAADAVPRTDGRIDARIAALPRNHLIAIYASARDHGLAPRAIGVASDSGDRLDFDFLPALVAEGLAPQPRGARGWWALVILLFAANLGTMVWKDVYRTAALADLVEAQQPLVAAARSLGQKLSSEDRTRAELIAARRAGNALATMAFVTRTLPAGAWVQRYNANAEMLRIAGYKQPDVDVLGALRKSGAFASVRATTSDVAAESTTGQPFDITAEWAQ
jgi:hypothetical protein